MVRHTIRGANSHKRHRIATYRHDDGSTDSETRKASQREIIREHPEEHVTALEHKQYPSRAKKYGYFDLNDSTIGPFSYFADNDEWQKRFNYAPLTLYPLEITDYDSSKLSGTLATTSAIGLIGYEESLGSSRQYKGIERPTTAQWHTIGGASGGAHHKDGISTYMGITGGQDPNTRSAARFMLNPTTGVMKNTPNPWTRNSLEQSQYVFQIGRHSGLTNGHTTGNNGWTLDNNYEVTWGANPISTGDAYLNQPAYAESSGTNTWDGKTIDGENKTFDHSHWRKYTVGYGHEYGKVLLEGSTSNSFNYGTEFISNPKWSTMTSRVYTPDTGKSTVDTGVISSYSSNILFAGTGVAIAGGVADENGEFSDGVLKIGVYTSSGLTWKGKTTSDDTATGKHGGVFLPYYNKEMTTQDGLTKSVIGVKYIGHKDFNGMSIGFVAQYTGGGTNQQQLRPTLEQTKSKTYYTEFVNSWENAFGITDGGVSGQKHVTKVDGTLTDTGLTQQTQKLNRKALMNNTGKDTAMNRDNWNRNWLSHAWVQYQGHNEHGQVVTIIPQAIGTGKLEYGQIIDGGRTWTDEEIAAAGGLTAITAAGGVTRDEGLDIAMGPSDEQRNAEFARKHQLVGEDFTLFSHSAADMYHPTALVVAQFVRDTAEIFEDMHITELYPNAINMSAKTTWMRNYDIIFSVELDESEDSTGPTFEKDITGLINQGQTFTFSQSACPYKIREIGERTINTDGKHQWEVQAMPAWDTWDHTEQPWSEWEIDATSGDTLNIGILAHDEIFQDRKINLTTGALSSSLGNVNGGFLGEFGMNGDSAVPDFLYLPHAELPSGMSPYVSGDIITLSGLTLAAVSVDADSISLGSLPTPAAAALTSGQQFINSPSVPAKTFDNPVKITIASAQNVSSTNFEVRGYLGNHFQIEEISGPNNNTSTGSKYFTTVTQVTALSAVAISVQIEIGNSTGDVDLADIGTVSAPKTYTVVERLSSTLIKVKRSNVDGTRRTGDIYGPESAATWSAASKGVIGVKNITAGTITKRQTGFVDRDKSYLTSDDDFKADLPPNNLFNNSDTIYLKRFIGTGPTLPATSEILGDSVSGSNIDTVQKVYVYNSKGPGWLPESASDVKNLSLLQKRVTDNASIASTPKDFAYVGDSARFVYKITQNITQPFLATSIALRGLLFADKDYVTIEDISFNLFSAGSWALAADVPHAYFDIREHVFDHMESDLGIPSYYWDAYSSLQLERQLITLNNFSRFDMHRKISLCWWDVLRIFDADEDIQVYIDGILQLAQDSSARMISGHLRENDAIAISCVVRNPHPEVKDIDMRLIFQVVNSLAAETAALTVTQGGD